MDTWNLENHKYANSNINAGIGYVDEKYFTEQLDNALKDIELPYKNIKFYQAGHACSNYVTQQMLQQFAEETDTLTIYVDSYIYGSKNTTNLKTTIFGIHYKELIWDSNVNPDTFDSSLGDPIYSPECVDVAEYIKENNTLIIHYNIFLYETIQDIIYALQNILKEVQCIHDLTDEELKEKRKKRKLELITNVLMESYTRQLKADKETLNVIEDNIKHDKYNLVNRYKKQEAMLRSIVSLEEIINGDKTKLYNEINTILNLDKVEDLTVRDNLIVIKTKLLYGHTENGKVYKLAPYDVGINFKTGEIYISCKDKHKRKSYWGDYCPHPHVSEVGTPCLGNASATIAELISASELLALTTIIINYLESINTQDVAGQNCVYWDRVDPETLEIIDNGIDEYERECEICGRITHEDNITYCPNCDRYVCEDCVVYIEDIEEYRCEDCAEEHTRCINCSGVYTYDNTYICEYCGEYVCTNCAISYTTASGDVFQFCCEDCKDRYIEENIIECDICGEEVPEYELYTCEICAKQGDINCIQQSDDGIYRCPECYKEYEESGE